MSLRTIHFSHSTRPGDVVATGVAPEWAVPAPPPEQAGAVREDAAVSEARKEELLGMSAAGRATLQWQKRRASQSE